MGKCVFLPSSYRQVRNKTMNSGHRDQMKTLQLINYRPRGFF